MEDTFKSTAYPLTNNRYFLAVKEKDKGPSKKRVLNNINRFVVNFDIILDIFESFPIRRKKNPWRVEGRKGSHIIDHNLFESCRVECVIITKFMAFSLEIVSILSSTRNSTQFLSFDRIRLLQFCTTISTTIIYFLIY